MPATLDFTDPGAVLQSVPDGRVAPIPLARPELLIYLALLIGIVPTALLTLGVGASLRRGRLVLQAAAIGLLGFLLPLAVFLAGLAIAGEALHVPLAFVVVRVLSVGFGWVLYTVARPHVRGHQVLGGRTLPLLWVLGPAFALTLLAPGPVVLLMVMPIFPLLQGILG